MPFQPINFLNMPILKNPLEQDFAKLLREGMQLGQEPGRLMRLKEQQELVNKLNNEKLNQAMVASQFAGPLNEQKLRGMTQTNDLQIPMAQSKMQAQEQQAMLNALKYKLLPGQIQADIDYKNARAAETGGPKSDLGKTLRDYENIVNKKGVNSEDAKAFRKAMDAKMASAENKGLTKQEKEGNAIARIEDQLRNKNLSEDERRRLGGTLATLQADQMKDRVPPSMWPKLQAGSVMQTLMDDINIDDATRYSGIVAKKQMGEDRVAGNDNWVKYLDSEKKMKSLAGQIRGFLGGSVQPIEMQRIIGFLEGNDWSLSPSQAKKLMKSAFSTLTKEHIRYVNNARNLPDLLVPVINKYEGTNNNAPNKGLNLREDWEFE